MLKIEAGNCENFQLKFIYKYLNKNFHTKFHTNQIIIEDINILGGKRGRETPICEHFQFCPSFQQTIKQERHIHTL